ncbi:MAG: hypothetical protein NC908_05085 [Candidatus Omnitrophica bacterium]|nr:hypothetical protein [Candidatus Omnitrophota bacterium]
MKIKVAASIIASDFSCLEREIKKVEQAGIDILRHLFSPLVVGGDEEVDALPEGETVFMPSPEYSYPTDIREWLEPYDTRSFDIEADHSYSSLAYLFSLGYQECMWMIAETHSKRDICDDMEGRILSIQDILTNAQHVPPSPIFTLSHPGCNCFLLCSNPSSPDAIPDDAPGLPLYGTLEEIQKYKEKIFPNLLPIAVDRLTFPPVSPHYSYVLSSKYGSSWKGNIKPVEVISPCRSFLPLGFVRLLEPGYTGFQLEVQDNIAKVFLVELNRVLLVPLEVLSILLLNPTQSCDTSRFVITKDVGEETVGVITRIRDNNKVYAYLPEYRVEVLLKDFTLYW